MSDERKTVDVDAQAEAFKRWFSATGHWVYEYRADAMRELRQWGIKGQPRWTPELCSALQLWVDADPLPALVAKLNAEHAMREAA